MGRFSAGALLTKFGRWLALPGFVAGLAAASSTMGGCDDGLEPTQLQGQVHFTFIHTSDIHSRLFPYNLLIGQADAGLGLGSVNTIANVGGLARVSHIVGRERARAGRSLHIDGGDCFQGAPVFNFYLGEAEIRGLSAMGTDAMLIANHEFDTGARNLGVQLQNWATFPALAANYQMEDAKFPGASPLGSIFQPYQVFDSEGLKVAVIGMANLSSLSSIYDSPNRLGITPLNSTQIAQAYVDLLRPQVDLVAIVSHLGLDHDQELIQTTTGIDVILGGHNHIVLQPPKRVLDCSANFDEEKQSYYVEVNGPDTGTVERRYCKPREVVLAHSGAFAKFVGRLDLVLSNDPNDFPALCESASAQQRCYDPVNGFEVLTSNYTLFPVNESVPADPTVSQLLEPYGQGLDVLANLELLVGYAPDGSRRFSSTGGDSPLGNMIATAMWLRLGIQTDFSLTNSQGIRADFVPGPLTIEQMYNVFPFDNSITKMQLSGVEVQDLFDFVARRSAGRGCVSQIQIAGARIVMNCAEQRATGIYIGVAQDSSGEPVRCSSDADCAGGRIGSCDENAGLCWQAIEPFGYYELATSNYLAGGGSGFRVLQRNTTQNDSRVQQRDALIDYIQGGAPCGSSRAGELRDCSTDADCGCAEGQDPSLCNVEAGTYTCACPDATIESSTCGTDAEKSCGGAGKCVLAACRTEVAAFQRTVCDAAPNDSIRQSCLESISPCVAGGEQCKFLACIDRTIGNFSDGRIRMETQ